MQATWIGFRAVRGLSTAALLWVSVAFADTEPMAGFEGRYVYDEYSRTFPNGGVVDLAGLGFRDAELSIFADGTLVSRMTASDGETVLSQGRATDLSLDGARGSWVEHWPELGYPVRRQVERTADGLTYSARFDGKRDALRYGSVDRGVLRRVGAADDAGPTAAATSPPLPRVPLSADEALADELEEKEKRIERLESLLRDRGIP